MSAARDVPAGQSWAFHDHRNQEQVMTQLAEIALLRAGMAQLQIALAAHTVLAGLLRLTRAEATVLGVLLIHELASAATIGKGLAVVLPKIAMSPETLRVLIHRLRLKLAPHGVAIHNLSSSSGGGRGGAAAGYYLAATCKAVLRQMAGLQSITPEAVSHETTERGKRS